jgi:hypothetical protein
MRRIKRGELLIQRSSRIRLNTSSPITRGDFVVNTWANSFVFCSNSTERKRQINSGRRVDERDLKFEVIHLRPIF